MSLFTSIQLLVFWFVETVGQTTFAAIMAVKMTGHKNSSTTFIWGTLPAKVTDFATLIHLIVFQSSQFNLLPLTLVLLVSGVRLLPLLSTTTKFQHKVQSGLLLNVVGQSTSIFQLLASIDQSLLVRRSSFFILDLGLYIFYCIRGLYLKSDGLHCQGLHENLHLGGGSTAESGSKRVSNFNLGKFSVIITENISSVMFFWSFCYSYVAYPTALEYSVLILNYFFLFAF